MPEPDDPATWDAFAPRYDEAADHGLRDPAVRAAWRDLLLEVMPPAPARIADLGCGSATLALLLADEGYAVDGVDFAPEMVRVAQAKVDGVDAVAVLQGDAAHPPLETGRYDAVLCRHVLWALPDQIAVLGRWEDLLVPGGRLVLIEGNWSSGRGLTAAESVALVEAAGRTVDLRPLPEPKYWGREIDDERYLVVSPG
ncbi:MAG: class I SAM-dependent methyltransferase [Nocardioides sp.]